MIATMSLALLSQVTDRGLVAELVVHAEKTAQVPQVEKTVINRDYLRMGPEIRVHRPLLTIDISTVTR